MHDRVEEPQLREARALIDNIRHGAAVESSSERLLAMIAELIESRNLDGSPPDESRITYQKSLG